MISIVRRSVVSCAIALASAFAQHARAQYATPVPYSNQDNTTPPKLADIGIDQKLGAPLPLDTTFINERGETIALRSLIHDRPVVLSLVYYGCPMLCTTVLNDELRSFSGLPLVMGKDYDVVTISFDPRETDEIASKKKREYAKRYGHDGAGENWHFLTGKPESIRAITESVGFRYAWDEQTKQFLHPSGLAIISPAGTITKYFFGIDYEPTDLRLALVEAGNGKVGGLTDKIMLYCYHYDATRGKYGLAVTRMVQAGGAITVIALAGSVAFMLRRERISRTNVM